MDIKCQVKRPFWRPGIGRGRSYLYGSEEGLTTASKNMAIKLWIT